MQPCARPRLHLPCRPKPAPPAPTPAPTQQPSAPAEAPAVVLDKKARTLRKKLRECEGLAAKQSEGKELNGPEAEKLGKAAVW